MLCYILNDFVLFLNCNIFYYLFLYIFSLDVFPVYYPIRYMNI